MTVETAYSETTLQGNDSTDTFDFDFKVLEAEHLVVERRLIATGLVAHTYSASEYVLTGLGDDTGSVQLNAGALSSDYELVIRREVPILQPLEIFNQGGFYPETVEEQLDLTTMQLQQINAILGRTFRLAPGETAQELVAAGGRADSVIGFDENGAFELKAAATFRGPTGATGASDGGAYLMIRDYYDEADGDNWQPACQLAVDAAIAAGVSRVLHDGSDIEWWEQIIPSGSPVVDATFYNTYSNLLIPACDYLDIDFCGATITIKDEAGGTRWPSAQLVFDDGHGSQWFGGGIRAGGNWGWLRIANVEITGGFGGDNTSNADAQLWDKGIDTSGYGPYTFGKLILENVTLRDFAGEVTYIGNGDEFFTTNCHFYNGGQSSFNPAGIMKGWHVNLRAGLSNVPVELIGGKGHTFVGGLFYSGGSNGCAFIGGPDPAFGSPYNELVRRTDAPPPLVEFIGTRFESSGQIILGAFHIGSMTTVDSAIHQIFYANVPNIQDCVLDITAILDRGGNNFQHYTITGSNNPAYKYKNIHVRISAQRTAYAVSLGHSADAIVAIGDGLCDRTSVSFLIEGEAQRAWALNAIPATANFEVPLMVVGQHFRPLAANILAVTADAAVDFYQDEFRLEPDADHTLTMGATWLYAHGQMLRYGYSGAVSHVVTFQKNGTGFMLGADRTIRRKGEYLEVKYDAYAGKWTELAFLDQGV